MSRVGDVAARGSGGGGRRPAAGLPPLGGPAGASDLIAAFAAAGLRHACCWAQPWLRSRGRLASAGACYISFLGCAFLNLRRPVTTTIEVAFGAIRFQRLLSKVVAVRSVQCEWHAAVSFMACCRASRKLMIRAALIHSVASSTLCPDAFGFSSCCYLASMQPADY